MLITDKNDEIKAQIMTDSIYNDMRQKKHVLSFQRKAYWSSENPSFHDLDKVFLQILTDFFCIDITCRCIRSLMTSSN